MAMWPFCGYNMGEYFGHWLEMGKKTTNKPLIFNVNWFRLTDEGKFMWPGFGDNFRVLEWILKRCEGSVDAIETEIGYIPKAEDINLTGLDYEIEPGRKFDIEELKKILTVEKDYWKADFENVKEFYAKFGDSIPAELYAELDAEIARLNK
jgi:phosphoenolpyruvate carboxykinase (GTP)